MFRLFFAIFRDVLNKEKHNNIVGLFLLHFGDNTSTYRPTYPFSPSPVNSGTVLNPYPANVENRVSS
jgi:hypothetical protein